MYRRIIAITFLLLSIMCLSAKGQTAIVYSYDSAGNRTSRTTVEATNVASVLSETSIDANDQLRIFLPVSKTLGNIASLASGKVEEKAETASLMWHFDFIENKCPMNEYAHTIGKYSWRNLSWIDSYKRNWMGNEALL